MWLQNHVAKVVKKLYILLFNSNIFVKYFFFQKYFGASEIENLLNFCVNIFGLVEL